METGKNGIVLALGDFDGFHKGHQAVLQKTIYLADKLGVKPCVFYLRRPIDDLLSGKLPPRLMSERTLTNKLKDFGVDGVYTIDFNDIAHLSPEKFAKTMLHNTLSVRAVVCGGNYHFGTKASGGAEHLIRYGNKYGFQVEVITMTTYKNEQVSSTRIRTALMDGDIKSANAMLGTPFTYNFSVVSGDRRGKRLGTPTINQLFPKGFIIPKFGVYASMAKVDNTLYPAMTNIGNRPTIGTASVRSETSILGYNGNLYGKRVEVSLLDFIRNEEKFDSLDELVVQMKIDDVKARVVYEEWGAEHAEY